MSELVRYEAACQAVAEAASVDEAKEFRDQSEAMRAYARQAKNKDLEIHAAEIRFRAERRIGELMAAQKEAGHLRPGNPDGFAVANGSEKNPLEKPPTLEEAGIDKKLADRARKYAAIPQEEFDGIVGDWRDKVESENARVSVNLMAAGEKAEAKKPKAKKPETEEPKQDDPNAKLRAEYRKLTDEAREEDWIGLRLELTEARKRIERQRGEISDLKQTVKEFSAGNDLGRVVSNLKEQLAAAKYARDEAKSATKREEWKRKKAEEEIERITGEVFTL